ncbi:SGNH/GDSL hydrolase family protein [Singulisphaera sp. PoT]|uniref:SGNH/GDSL hydrolase family protein n=1 Tax=Singulisphaera sp. PoT TaxID=3411797 RepID=UPI003BF524DB
MKTLRRFLPAFLVAGFAMAMSSLAPHPRTAEAGGPPIPPEISKTKAQASTFVIGKNYTVVESDTDLSRIGDGVTPGGRYYGLTPKRMLLDRLRRAASRAANNNVIDNLPMTSPPTVTSASGDSQTNSYYLANGGVLQNQDKIIVVGGVVFANTSGALAGNYINVKSVSTTSGSNVGGVVGNQNGWYIETMTDSPNISFGYFRTAEGGVMVAVSENGGPMQYVSTTPTTMYNNGNPCGSNPGSVTVAFGSSKVRRVRLELGNQQTDETCGGAGGVAFLRRIAVDPSYTIWKPKDTDVINAAFVGDSYTAGSPRDTGMQSVNWARTVAAKLGWRPTCMALGSTGYSKASGALPPASDPVRIADLSAQAYDVYVFALGTNDVNGNDNTATALPDLQAKALTCFQAARAANPIAPIIVVSPWPRTTFPLQTQADLAAAVQAAFNQFADSNSLYIPIYDDPSGNWMTGTSYQGQLNNSNDISFRYIWTDRIHPVKTGHYYYGDRIAQAIRDWLMATSVTIRMPARRPDEGLVFRMPERPVAPPPYRYRLDKAA